MLRDLLPFTQPLAGQKTAAIARGLLEIIARLPPLAAAASLTTRAIPAIAAEANLHMRFKLLEDARQEAERALPVLEELVIQAALPLPHPATTAAIHADNLLKLLAATYADTAREIHKLHLNGGLNHLYHRSILRAISMLARRQLLAYSAYATPSSASWQMLHELYLLACNPSAQPLNSETAPIEHEYLGALLFAYMEPGKLPRHELSAVHTCTHQLAAYAAVGETLPGTQHNATESCFLVRPEEGSPGHPLNRLPAGTHLGGGLIIDCSQVLAALDRNLIRQSGKAVQPDLDAPPNLLQSLRVVIAGKSARRFSRTKFRPRADLIGGLGAVINFVNGNACSRRSLDSIGRNEGRGFITSEWSLVDEGPDGFRIRFIKGEKSQIGVGELVALQPRESSKIHICLVRRITSTGNRLELGLQLLSPQVSVVDIKPSRSPATRGIFLHSLPAYGKFSGLIVPPGKLTSGQEITFSTLGRTLHRQIGKCIEANEGLEFVALDPLPD